MWQVRSPLVSCPCLAYITPFLLIFGPPREVLIKRLEHDLVTAATKFQTHKEETARKLLFSRQEVNYAVVVDVG